MEPTLINLVVLPIGLGLLGFVEPCSIGSTLVFVKTIEGRNPAGKLAQVGVFALTRAVFIGLLGILAVVVGAAFLGFQRGGWVILGTLYVLLGLLYLTGRAKALMVTLGPSLARLAQTRGSAALGVLFGLNIPACAAPLIFALLGATAAGGAAGATLATGFAALALFGLALSLPLLLAVPFGPARRALDRLAGLSERIPFWTGLLFVVLGVWSIWFALFGTLRA
jgi:cytochrome c-type biogenesis protein